MKKQLFLKSIIVFVDTKKRDPSHWLFNVDGEEAMVLELI